MSGAGGLRAAVASLALFPQARHHLLYAVAPAPDSSQEDGSTSAEQAQSLHEASTPLFCWPVPRLGAGCP
ncbi:MAG: hypothetical protein Q8R98_05975 [Rubrivivax sp.]|nr:hypothetical protein [Rubrivivax sp.]